MSFLEKLGTEASCFETGCTTGRSQTLFAQGRHRNITLGPQAVLLCSIPNPSHFILCSWGLPFLRTPLTSSQSKVSYLGSKQSFCAMCEFPQPSSRKSQTQAAHLPQPTSSPQPLKILSKKSKWCFGTKFSRHGTGFYSCPLSLIKHRVHQKFL